MPSHAKTQLLPSLMRRAPPSPRCARRGATTTLSARSCLSDSHIVKRQSSSVLDRSEVLEASSHDLGSGLAVVAGPAAEAGDDPGGEGERALGVGIALPFCLARELGRDGFEDGLVVRIEGIGQAL